MLIFKRLAGLLLVAVFCFLPLCGRAQQETPKTFWRDWIDIKDVYSVDGRVIIQLNYCWLRSVAFGMEKLEFMERCFLDDQSSQEDRFAIALMMDAEFHPGWPRFQDSAKVKKRLISLLIKNDVFRSDILWFSLYCNSLRLGFSEDGRRSCCTWDNVIYRLNSLEDFFSRSDPVFDEKYYSNLWDYLLIVSLFEKQTGFDIREIDNPKAVWRHIKSFRGWITRKEDYISPRYGDFGYRVRSRLPVAFERVVNVVNLAFLRHLSCICFKDLFFSEFASAVTKWAPINLPGFPKTPFPNRDAVQGSPKINIISKY